MKLRPSSRLAELPHPLGEELLAVHKSYGPLIQKLLQKFNAGGVSPQGIKGLAHITGGGFLDNLPRVLPKNCDVIIRIGSWEVLPIFRLLAERGGIREEELYRVFNMGVGMTLIASSDTAPKILQFIRAKRQPAWIIGEVIRGRGRVSLL